MGESGFVLCDFLTHVPKVGGDPMIRSTFKYGRGREPFPGVLGLPIELETLLSATPEWDSMAPVNFKVFLEETFG